MTNLIANAAAFAGFAHGYERQLRKYTNAPYIIHPMEVADIVTTVTDDEEVIAAAWLHDVVEDTEVTHEILLSTWPPRVVQFVMEVTDVSTPENGNRAFRKAMDREHLAKASPQGQTIKLADLISNTSSITKYDPGFSKVYLAEKRALMSVLTKGDKTLYDRCIAILEEHGA